MIVVVNGLSFFCRFLHVDRRFFFTFCSKWIVIFSSHLNTRLKLYLQTKLYMYIQTSDLKESFETRKQAENANKFKLHCAWLLKQHNELNFCTLFI